MTFALFAFAPFIIFLIVIALVFGPSYEDNRVRPVYVQPDPSGRSPEEERYFQGYFAAHMNREPDHPEDTLYMLGYVDWNTSGLSGYNFPRNLKDSIPAEL